MKGLYMKSLSVFSWAVFFLVLTIVNAEAKCLRCGTGTLACEGDSKFAAINSCGQPDYSEDIGDDTQGSVRRGDVDLANRKVEKLFYNCGDGDFVKILTIKNGKIVSINDGERGSGRGRCQ
jgi:hypothetical protein